MGLGWGGAGAPLDSVLVARNHISPRSAQSRDLRQNELMTRIFLRIYQGLYVVRDDDVVTCVAAQCEPLLEPIGWHIKENDDVVS